MPPPPPPPLMGAQHSDGSWETARSSVSDGAADEEGELLLLGPPDTAAAPGPPAALAAEPGPAQDAAAGVDPEAGLRHDYLGGDLEDVQASGGWGMLEEGSRHSLPTLLLHGVILFPGCTLPLKATGQRDRGLLRAAMAAPPPLSRLLFAVNMDLELARRPGRHVGCTAEVKRLGDAADGALHVLALAKQRGAVDLRSRELRRHVLERGTWPPCLAVSILSEGCDGPVPRPVREGAAWWPAWAARPFDLGALSADAARLAGAVLGPAAAAHHAPPLGMSYHLAAALPLPPPARQALLEAPHTADRLRAIIRLLKALQYVVCRGCNKRLAAMRDILPSSAGLFVNAHGYVHDTVMVTSVRGASLQGGPETEHSWFPGYAWTIASCSDCLLHLGWRFTAVEQGRAPATFWGLRRAALRATDEGQEVTMLLVAPAEEAGGWEQEQEEEEEEEEEEQGG